MLLRIDVHVDDSFSIKTEAGEIVDLEDIVIAGHIVECVNACNGVHPVALEALGEKGVLNQQLALISVQSRLVRTQDSIRLLAEKVMRGTVQDVTTELYKLLEIK